MKKLDECKYVTSIDQCTPDANNYIRLTTEYLSEINLDTIQTTDGVIHLLEQMPKLKHNDKIMFLGKMIDQGKLEGVVHKIDEKTYKLFGLMQIQAQMKKNILPPKKNPPRLHFDNF